MSDSTDTPDGPEQTRSYDALLAAHGSDLDHEVFGTPDPGRPGADRPRRGQGNGRRFAVLGVALAVLLAGVVFVFSLVAPVVRGFLEPNDYDGPGAGSVSVTVNPGDSGSVIGQTLVNAGVVKTTEAFQEAMSAKKGDEIQPGTYTLQKGMKASDALSALRSKDARNENRVTVREGLRATEIYEALSKATGVPVAEYQKAAKNAKAIGLPAQAKGNPEGYLFPATYTFPPKTSATDQLKQLVAQANSRHTALGIAPEDLQREVTVASIVEAEARIPQDYPKVARVIYNRLEKPMRLQLDSTVVYGLGKRIITTSDAERADASNKYNTYQHDGLPPGPINNPGEQALEAAAKPAAGDWLYFVAINPETGETVFSKTLEEHNRSVLKFQQWCQANPGKC